MHSQPSSITVDDGTESPELQIPAPRSGHSYELFTEEVLGGWHGRHGCLDAIHDH